MHPTIESALTRRNGRLSLRDAGTVRDQIDEIVRQAVFGKTGDREAARYAIHAAAPELGAIPASIAGLYEARGRGEVGGFTVPAINIRGLAYDMSRAVFRAMRETGAAVVFELARSEMGYSAQDPAEFAAVVLAAAIAEEHRGPVFLQADHTQVNAARYAREPEAELRDLEDLVRRAVAAQIYNVDIDSSTVVDLAYPSVGEQQALNVELTARLARLVRQQEPGGLRISIGGEIGEVGKHNSTVEELTAYAQGVEHNLGSQELSKVSVQTGTSHGGVPRPDGTVAEVSVDFDTLRSLSRVARESFGMAGAVQHGASTLPDDLFHHFPEAETAEIHLATGFQNLILDHERFPAELLDEIGAWVDTNLAGERLDGDSDTQFRYRSRKKAWGPFKERLWSLPADSRDPIMADLSAKVVFLVQQLNAAGTAALADQHVAVRAVEVEAPAG